MEKMIDLHIHTNVSDGILTPKEVIDVAVQNGVEIISIADHDTIDAYSDELFDYANEKGVKIINAVEISTVDDKNKFHILGYNFDLKNEELISKLAVLRNARHDYLYNVSKKLNELGYILNVEELDKIEAVTKAHIAMDVIENKENEELLLKNFGHIPDKGEFIETVMNKGCPAFVKKETITSKEASELIKRAGGKVILAHPMSYTYEGNLTDEEIFKVVQEMNADGIEANYIYADKDNNKINEIEKWNKFAKENNLITTLGSDFHFIDGIHPEIGLINENIKIDKEMLDKIINDLLN